MVLLVDVPVPLPFSEDITDLKRATDVLTTSSGPFRAARVQSERDTPGAFAEARENYQRMKGKLAWDMCVLLPLTAKLAELSFQVKKKPKRKD